LIQVIRQSDLRFFRKAALCLDRETPQLRFRLARLLLRRGPLLPSELGSICPPAWLDSN